MFGLIVASAFMLCATTAEELKELPGEACYRNCKSSIPRVCYFDWHLEHYHVLGPACGSCGSVNGNVSDCFTEQCITADGVERGVMSINRKIPGPEIHVCKDDLIVVDVTNSMGGTSASIHWHGFRQRKTPHYDGVPFITQCPIQFATTFRYAFRASEAGTHFYHSHSGHHKVNGIYGGIVVRQNPMSDPNSKLYDHDLKEHLIVISDWMFHDGEWFMPGIRSQTVLPTNVLINGKGTVRDPKTGRSKTLTPLAVFRVTRGQRYRFRLVNSGSLSCPMTFEIDKHSLQIISSDSFALRPATVSSLVSNPGERYDFVVKANQIGDSFLIRLQAIATCEVEAIQQFAILSYQPESVSSIRLAFPSIAFPPFNRKFGNLGSLNHPNTTCNGLNFRNLCITDLNSYVEDKKVTDVEPDQRFCLGFKNTRQELSDVYAPITYRHFANFKDDTVVVGTINNISFNVPPFPLLTQPENLNESMFCDEHSIPASCGTGKTCHCFHRIKVSLNCIVELIVVDESPTWNNFHHPFHLHGYQAFVMGMGQHADRSSMNCFQARKQARSLAKRKRYPLKDTVSIPSKGFAVIRFRADNPGWWFLHCHYEWHLAIGMALVLQVGEPHQMVKPPPDFPKCNSFKPKIDSNFNLL